MESKAIRLHNPLNIKKGSKWQGLSDVQSDSTFCCFKSDFYGFRAAFKILQSYNRRGINTVGGIVQTWAPPSENVTERYIDFVCDFLELSEYDTIDLSDRILTCSLIDAMSRYESGKWYDYDLIRSAYDAAFIKT